MITTHMVETIPALRSIKASGADIVEALIYFQGDKAKIRDHILSAGKNIQGGAMAASVTDIKSKIKKPEIDITNHLPELYVPHDVYSTDNKIEKTKILLKENFNFRRNVITGIYEYAIKKIDPDFYYEFNDRAFNSIKIRLNVKLVKKLTEADLRMIIESDFTDDYSPIAEYFNTLESWDGETDYIHILSDMVTAKPGQYGENEAGNAIDAQWIWNMYLERWIIASVATMLQRNVNHSCLTLLGDQGLGKTTYLRKLGINENLTYIGSINPSDKDSRIYYAEKCLIVLDELESTTKYELSALKSNMTLPSVTVRRPYARKPENLPRRASFCASANNISVLSDLTGSRRWLCVEVIKIDYEGITPELMRKVYSQAFSLLNSGVKYWFEGSEIQFLEKNNTRFQQSIAEEEALLKLVYLPIDRPGAAYTEEHLTNTELISKMSEKFPGMKFSNKKLGEILNKHGFTRKARSGDHLQAYIVRIR